jgi:hypothetical protein
MVNLLLFFIGEKKNANEMTIYQRYCHCDQLQRIGSSLDFVQAPLSEHCFLYQTGHFVSLQPFLVEPLLRTSST